MSSIYMPDTEEKGDLAERGPIKLLLSGGGFRATLFHLGVLRYLHERSRLPQVAQVFSVSGGSILAAYLAINWQSFLTPNGFESVASELVNYIRSDIRGRIVRRYIAYWGFSIALLCGLLSIAIFARPYNRVGYAIVAAFSTSSAVLLWFRPRLIHLFRADLEKFLARADDRATPRNVLTLKDLPNDKDGSSPLFHILATDMTSGSPWVFANRGIYMGDREWDFFADELYPLASAVAASAAFPPLFSPVRFSCDVDDDLFKVDHYLSDGGVYDNLGIVAAIASPWARADLTTVISNAERRFDTYASGSFGFIVKRAARSSDIQMTRASALHSHLVVGEQIKLGDDFEVISSVFPIAVQRVVRNIRTDLDAFTPAECQLLYFKGYLSAWCKLDHELPPLGDFSYSQQGIPLQCKTNDRWLPFNSKDLEQIDLTADLEASHRTKWNLFVRKDWRGVCFLLAAIFCLLILNPLSWTIGRAVWTRLPSRPSIPEGDWYTFRNGELPADCPAQAERLKNTLIDSSRAIAQTKVGNDVSIDSRVFISEPLWKAYGLWPHGDFVCTFRPNASLSFGSSFAFLIHPDGTLTQLDRHVQGDGTLLVKVPRGHGSARLCVAVAFWDKSYERHVTTSKVANANEALKTINFDNTTSVTRGLAPYFREDSRQ